MGDRYDRLAEEIVHGAQERYVAALTEEFARMLEEGVANPDRLALLARTSREAAMRVWAEHEREVSAEVRQAFTEALQETDQEALSALRTAHPDVMAVSAGAMTEWAKNRVSVAATQCAEIIRRDNVALADHMADEWYGVVSEAVATVDAGGSRKAALADASERMYAALADAGGETIDYRSGQRYPIDAAVRRHIVTQQAQCRAAILDARLDEWGHDLVYTSAHYGARPSHSAWQGKVFSRSGQDRRYPPFSDTGYGTAGGLCGCNCRHSYYPYVEGLSQLPDTDFSAQERRFGMTSEEYYRATQRQRAMEREVRKTKRRIALGEAHGADMSGERFKLGLRQKRLREHVERCGLTRDYSREHAYGVGKQPRALKKDPTKQARGIVDAIS